MPSPSYARRGSSAVGGSSSGCGHEPTGDRERLSDFVIGRLDGGGRARVLMIGHTDTVFDPGTVAERPLRVEGDRAFGPGVTDMKGGLLTGFFAFEILQAAGFDGFGTITYICNPDEEIGSRQSWGSRSQGRATRRSSGHGDRRPRWSCSI